ncbi:MAG: hypothetical protein LBK06_05305 [Planctomycetaceae bacterium]|jgi:hypothetical protein|nr:hypothetical protein [Planctomycetaceae bacterium]
MFWFFIPIILVILIILFVTKIGVLQIICSFWDFFLMWAVLFFDGNVEYRDFSVYAEAVLKISRS